MKSIRNSLITLALFCAALSAQPTCAVVVPGVVGAAAPISTISPAKVSVTMSGIPRANHAVIWIDYTRYETVGLEDPAPTTPSDSKVPFLAPWTTSFPPAVFGDGNHYIYAQVFDVLTNEVTGAPSCTTPTVTFAVRSMGFSNQSISSTVTNAIGSLNKLTYDGGNAARGEIYVDGNKMFGGDSACGRSLVTSASGGWGTPGFNPNCYRGGTGGTQHVVMMTEQFNAFTDPVMKSDSVSLPASGTTLAISNHFHSNGSVVTLASSGTLPTITAGGTLAALTAGTQGHAAGTSYYCGNPCTGTNGGTPSAAASVSGGVITVTLTTAPSVTIAQGTRVFIRNMKVNPQLGQACDGEYAIASLSSQTLFTLAALATCPNGVVSSAIAFEVLFEPWFVIYVDASTISLSQTATVDQYGEVIPGPPVTLSGGTGTLTLLERMRSPYMGHTDAINQVALDVDNLYGPSYALKLMTFTGTGPMEIEPKYDKFFNVAGATDTLNVRIKNSDLTFTAAACGSGSMTCTYSDLGIVTGQMSFNSSTGVVTYNASNTWTNPNSYPVAWGQVLIHCPAACAGNTHGLHDVAVLFENCGAGPCATPHFSTDGQLRTAFTPGKSFFPISGGAAVGASFQTTTNWVVAAFKSAYLNSSYGGASVDDNLSILHATSCPVWPSASMVAAEAFARASNSYIKLDLESYFFGQQTMKPAVFPAIMANLGYDRKSCLQSLASYMKNSGLYFAAGIDDESSFFFGNFFAQNVTLGGPNWTSATVSGCPGAMCQIDFAIQNINNFIINASGSIPITWNQATGQGAPFQVQGAGSHSFLNGIFLPTSTSSTDWIAPCTNSCVNGSYNAGTGDGAAKLVLNPVVEEFITTNPTVTVLNTSALPNEGFNTCISWTTAGVCGPSSNLGSAITVAGSIATVTWTGVQTELPSSVVVRVWGSSSGLNIVANGTVTMNTLSWTYPGGTGGVAPASGPYTVSTDPGLWITIDSGMGADSIGNFISLWKSASPTVTLNFTTLGAIISNASPSITNGMVSYEGYPNAQSAMEYIATGVGDVLGVGPTVSDAASTCNSTQGPCGLLAWQAQPAMALLPAGHQYVPYSQGIGFNPSTDHPTGLSWDPAAQMSYERSAMSAGVVGVQMYTFNSSLALWYDDCCALPAVGTGGAADSNLNPFNNPMQWNGLANSHVNIKLSERFELGAPCNHQHFGDYFFTDCHQDPTWGNEVWFYCTSQMPYGSFSVDTNAIAGGALWLRQSDAHTTWLTKISGNPSTLSREWCAAPGMLSVIIAEPPGTEVIDTLNFGPIPASPPGGATKMVVRPTYSTFDSVDNQGFDCTSVCQVSIDHHNISPSYQILWMNNNYQPVGSYNPPLIALPNQHLQGE